MTDAGFEKMIPSEKKLYGPRKLLLCGFPAKAQPLFLSLFDMIGIHSLPVIWAAGKQADDLVSDLFDSPDGFGFGDSSNLPRSQAVKAPADRPELTATITAQALAQLIVAPCYASMPDSELRRQAKLIKEIAQRTGSELTRGLEKGIPIPQAEEAAPAESAATEAAPEMAEDQAS